MATGYTFIKDIVLTLCLPHYPIFHPWRYDPLEWQQSAAGYSFPIHARFDLAAGNASIGDTL